MMLAVPREKLGTLSDQVRLAVVVQVPAVLTIGGHKRGRAGAELLEWVGVA